jgi:hypothetical protein
MSYLVVIPLHPHTRPPLRVFILEHCTVLYTLKTSKNHPFDGGEIVF